MDAPQEIILHDELKKQYTTISLDEFKARFQAIVKADFFECSDNMELTLKFKPGNSGVFPWLKKFRSQFQMDDKEFHLTCSIDCSIPAGFTKVDIESPHMALYIKSPSVQNFRIYFPPTGINRIIQDLNILTENKQLIKGHVGLQELEKILQPKNLSLSVWLEIFKICEKHNTLSFLSFRWPNPGKELLYRCIVNYYSVHKNNNPATLIDLAILEQKYYIKQICEKEIKKLDEFSAKKSQGLVEINKNAFQLIIKHLDETPFTNLLCSEDMEFMKKGVGELGFLTIDAVLNSTDSIKAWKQGMAYIDAQHTSPIWGRVDCARREEHGLSHADKYVFGMLQ